MGKIILTERQYRNLNQILIGKEVENNKGRLNEITEDEKLTADSVGTKIQGIYKFCNVSVATLVHLKCISDMTNQLNRLKTKEQFDIAGKITSYWQQRRPRNKDETADWWGWEQKKKRRGNLLQEGLVYFSEEGDYGLSKGAGIEIKMSEHYWFLLKVVFANTNLDRS